MRVIDLAGREFGRLTVIRRDGSDSQSSAKWLCRCECGVEKSISGHHLRKGAVKSCGCLRKQVLDASRYKHGASYTPTWNVWRGIIKRCTSRNCKQYRHYGGRGISICKRWLSFENFLADMGERPEGATIERLEVNGNYEPGNCEWIPASEQPKNTRNTIRVVLDGQPMCLSDACEKLGLSYSRTRDRMKALGWSFEEAISEPKKVNGTLYASEVNHAVR